MGWNINPRNDKNKNDVPDDIDRAIVSYIVWELVKAILVIIGIYSFLKLLGKV